MEGKLVKAEDSILQHGITAGRRGKFKSTEVLGGKYVSEAQHFSPR